ncbi:Putative aminoacrylate peracid reductase RutC [Roseovarius albus]|uniref:Putative aminoacrylate peracid reductase RutC n=1 Tax=Roseovarius albus TaxID=1247867 RepID=A0A1X7A9G6_9RHOB|nr:RidA family protein [Roseovarius albus]SLN73480.1 Putative aminoacrylate peracid reductase RutC [Roseovarius albus]
MPRKNFNPKNFELDVDHPWTMAIHTNDMVVLNPQLDLDHPDDLDAQTTVSLNHIRKLLADIDCEVSDITNLRVSYVNKGDVDEDTYRQSILDQMRDLKGATLEMVPFDRLVLPELLVEICTYAMRRQTDEVIPKVSCDPGGLYHPGLPLSQGVKCGQMIYAGEQVARAPDGTVLRPGDIVGQCSVILDQLTYVLAGLDADLSDVVRLNIFYDASTSPSDWAACLRQLKARFGDAAPSLTAIPLPQLFPSGKQIMLSAWAMRGQDGVRLKKRHSEADDNITRPGPTMWRHAVACEDMIFAGGISTVCADGTVGAMGDQIAQTKQTMMRIGTLMNDLGGSLQDVHKTNSYYVLSTVDEFNSNLQTRSDCFEKPGPGSVGLPLDSLSYSGQRIEVEAILVKDK